MMFGLSIIYAKRTTNAFIDRLHILLWKNSDRSWQFWLQEIRLGTETGQKRVLNNFRVIYLIYIFLKGIYRQVLKITFERLVLIVLWYYNKHQNILLIHIPQQ